MDLQNNDKYYKKYLKYKKKYISLKLDNEYKKTLNLIGGAKHSENCSCCKNCKKCLHNSCKCKY